MDEDDWGGISDGDILAIDLGNGFFLFRSRTPVEKKHMSCQQPLLLAVLRLPGRDITLRV